MGTPRPRARWLWLSSIALAALILGVLPTWQTSLSPAQRNIAVASAPLAGETASPPLMLASAVDGHRLACQSLHTLSCRKRGVTYDPTGYVRRDVQGELIVLRELDAIVRKHPDWTQEQTYDELTREVYRPDRRRRIQSAFLWVRKTLEKILKDQSGDAFNRYERAALFHRLRKVKLELPPPANIYADEPDLITKNGVMFESLPNGTLRIRVGGAYLSTATSWFNLVFSMAHEFGHSIDPCEVQDAKIRVQVYPKLVQCFTQNQLIRANTPEFVCGVHDQVSEAFADWLASQVTRRALDEFSKEYDSHQLLQATVNAVKDLCDQEESLDATEEVFHPAPQVRIDDIFGAEPGIRTLLGCPVKPYCSFDTL